MRTFVMGDVHGSLLGIKQCIERSGFNLKEDRLIQLGDVVDGYPDVGECVDYLLFEVKNLVQIIGNHDKWFLEWATSEREIAWDTQGGRATFNSYVPPSHVQFFKDAHLYFVDEKNRLYVHGGLDPDEPDMTKQKADTLMWDRRLNTLARKRASRGGGSVFPGYDEIFVGHTSTTYSCGGTEPQKFCNLWMLDTGAGFEGKLSIMDVESKEFWQSDFTYKLYPESDQAKRVAWQILQDQTP